VVDGDFGVFERSGTVREPSKDFLSFELYKVIWLPSDPVQTWRLSDEITGRCDDEGETTQEGLRLFPNCKLVPSFFTTVKMPLKLFCRSSWPPASQAPIIDGNKLELSTLLLAPYPSVWNKDFNLDMRFGHYGLMIARFPGF
jgi:hypothetical protein